MSASREKKIRQERASSGYVDPKQVKADEEKAKERRTTNRYTAILALFVLCAVALLVWNSNIIQRGTDALKVDGETYSAADASYFYHNAYNTFMSQNGSYASYLFDSSKSLRDQENPYGEGSWFDFFVDQAASNIHSTKLLTKAAEEEGFDAGSAVEDSLANAWNAIKENAAANNISATRYIKALYGPMVNKQVFERDFRQLALADAYTSAYLDTLSYTDDEIQQAYDADPDSYSSADVEYILITTGAASDATDEEKASLLEEAKGKADAALERCQNGELLEVIGKDLDATYTHTTTMANGSSALQSWAFESGRTEGDSDVLTYGTDAGYYVAVFHGKSRNDFNAVSVRHILVDSEDKANELLEQWKSGEATEDSFAALATENSTDGGSASNGGLYASVVPGQMVEEFENWCFDPARKTGDTGIVQTSYGYHIMYFVGADAQPYWQTQVTNTLKSADYDEWYSNIMGDTEPEVEQLDGMKYIN